MESRTAVKPDRRYFSVTAFAVLAACVFFFCRYAGGAFGTGMTDLRSSFGSGGQNFHQPDGSVLFAPDDDGSADDDLPKESSFTIDEESAFVYTKYFKLTTGTYQMHVNGQIQVMLVDSSGNILCRNSVGEGTDGSGGLSNQAEEDPGAYPVTEGRADETDEIAQEAEQMEAYEDIIDPSSEFSIRGRTSMRLAISLEDELFEGINLSEDEIQEKLVEALSYVSIIQTSDEYVFGMDHNKEISEVVSLINKKQHFDTLLYCFNRDSEGISMSYLDSNLPSVTVSICNEEEVRQSIGRNYLLMNVSGDYLSLTDLYQPVLINNEYVLMEKRKEPGDGFTDVSDLVNEKKGISLNLPAGLYRLRFEGIDPQYQEADFPLSYKMISVSDGKIITKGLLSGNERNEASVYFSKAQKDRKFVLLCGEKEISCEKIEIAKPMSTFTSYWERDLSEFISQIGRTAYKGGVLIFSESSAFSTALLENRALRQLGATIPVKAEYEENLDVYHPELSGIDTEWLILPNKTLNVLPLLSKYIVVSSQNGYALLVPETDENRKLLDEAGIETLSHDRILSTDFYRDDYGLSTPIIVPKGTFRFTVSLAEDVKDQESVCLYRKSDRSVIVTKHLEPGQTEIIVTAGALRMISNIIAGPGTDENGAMPSVSDKELGKYKITSVEWVSDDLIFDLSGCTIQKGGSFEDGVIKGSGQIRLRTPIFRSFNGEKYNVILTVKGKTSRAEICIINVQYRNEIINVRTVKNNVSDLGGGRYEVFAKYHPAESRKFNLLEFTAEFEGDYEIEEIRIAPY